MTETVNEYRVTPESNGAAKPVVQPLDRTDQPIPLWPEGVVVAAAGIALLVIGLKHRTWLQRKTGEVQRAVEEFQRHGGLEDLTMVARQAQEFLRGAGK